jgi:hypothetical protein
MIILEHDHTAQIMPVRIDPAHQHTILLYQSETWRGLARTGDNALPACCAGGIAESAGPIDQSSSSLGAMQ